LTVRIGEQKEERDVSKIGSAAVCHLFYKPLQ
jgi:hypothetical protein